MSGRHNNHLLIGAQCRPLEGALHPGRTTSSRLVLRNSIADRAPVLAARAERRRVSVRGPDRTGDGTTMTARCCPPAGHGDQQ